MYKLANRFMAVIRMSPSKEKMPGPAEYMNPTEALIMIMWTAENNLRRADGKANTWLTFFVGIGSVLLGAGFSGFYTYWYSTDQRETVALVGWIAMIVTSFVLFMIVPRVIESLRARLYTEEGVRTLEAAEQGELISAIVKGMAVRRLEAMNDTKKKGKARKKK